MCGFERIRVSAILRVVGGFVLFAVPAAGQGQPTSASDGEAAGIPIDNRAVIENCSACHTRDDAGLMTRLSYLRKTPEGWQTSIRRMVALNEVGLDPAAAREIVRYLSNNHGLAPEELRPGNFEVERRMIDYAYEADDDTEETCTKCHSMGQITQRRTKDEWGLLMATHRGLYPLSETQGLLYNGPPPDSPGAPEDTRHPMDKAVAHLSEAFPLETPDWADWSATMQPARLSGRWVVSANQTGYGQLFGTVEIEAVPGTNDEFTTTTTLAYARSGRTVTRQGRTIVYTGFQWRGRSTLDTGLDPLREVLFVERDWEEISGRWFAGDYDEFGLDVRYKRVGSDPVVVGMEPRVLKIGASDQAVTIFGANLPATLSADAVDLGPGITVRQIVSASEGSTTVLVDVNTDASLGPRDIYVSGTRLPKAGVVYDQIHSIRVSPDWAMARVGGVAMPKGHVQFEARAYHDGPDGKTGTDDDVDLDLVDATWSIEEYAATFVDDDVDYVGAIDQNGLFTPAVDGPNPERSGDRNNIGDVWAVASVQPDGAERPLRARSHLIVTVPLYLRWDPLRDPLGDMR
jgi:quinohemoprotein amine dehydrogenase